MTDTDTKAEPSRAEWQALVPLSISRRGDKEKAADFVQAGETVLLTEEESAGFLKRHQVPVIRPASQKNEPLPQISARQMFRPIAGPGQFGARPDPAGATRVITNPADPASHPEANAPEVTDPDAGNEGATARSRGGRGSRSS